MKELDDIAGRQSGELAARGADIARAAGFQAVPLTIGVDGPVWRGVLHSADERDASVVIVGTRGLSGVSRVLGSVSNAVLHRSRRPVLVVPAV